MNKQEQRDYESAQLIAQYAKELHGDNAVKYLASMLTTVVSQKQIDALISHLYVAANNHNFTYTE